MSWSCGSKASQDTYPSRGWDMGQVVGPGPEAGSRWMAPPSSAGLVGPLPTRTREPSIGETAIALTAPSLPSRLLARDHELPPAAPFVVSQTYLAPVQSRSGFVGSIANGAMNWKFAEGSSAPEMPLVAFVQLAPPSVDLSIESRVCSE